MIDRTARLLHMIRFVVLIAAAAFPGAVWPHGPEGDHADAGGTNASASRASPRFEAASDTFEVVAVLAGAEFSMLIDQYETNAPVLGARVEVEAAGRKAQARFRADQGDYAVDDPAFAAALSLPGEHPVVLAVIAGDQSDLLSAVLVVPAREGKGSALGGGRADQRIPWLGWSIAVVAGAAVAALALRRRRARRLRDVPATKGGA